MFKKRSKKGLSHVDWAMSLGIFLLYLAWFFIFVKPLFAPAESMDVLLDILDDGVRDTLFLDIERVKVYVPASLDNHYEPIVIPYLYDWTVSDITHSADYFEIDDSKMFFLGNLSNSSMFSMFHPHEALYLTPRMPVIANEYRARFGDFSAHFNEYLLDYAFYNGDLSLRGFTVEVDEVEIDEIGSFDNRTIMAKYQRAGDYINLSSYVFSENSKIYSYITPADYRNHSVRIEFTTYNYTYYYFDSLDSGEIRYSIGPNCAYHEADFLDLYGPGSGLLITFDREITMRLCSNETNPYVMLEFDVYTGEETSFNIIFHDGDADDVLDYPLEPIVGVEETLRTVSSDKVAYYRNRDYDYLKQVFGYPKDRDFNVSVSSDVVSASYGLPQPDIADVYAKRIEGVILDKDYRPERALITLTVW
jgi:hypothetical protein